MKTIKLFVSVLALFPAGVFAAPSIFFGGGVNLSSTTYTDTIKSEKSPLQGFNMALGFEQNLTDRVSIISGFSIETRGEKTAASVLISAPGDPVKVETDTSTDYHFLYLQLPLLAQYSIPAGPGKINLFCGPELGIMLNSEARTTSSTAINDTGIIPAPNDTVDLGRQVRMIDGGITIGAGYEFAIGRHALFLRPSYYYGLGEYLLGGKKGTLSNIKVVLGCKINR